VAGIDQGGGDQAELIFGVIKRHSLPCRTKFL
jgi:hypothetical protein